MFRKFTLTLAIAALSTFSATAMAQTPEVVPASAAKMELASYGQNYSSAGCSTCGTSGAYAGAYGGGTSMAFGRAWGGAASNRDCSRFYHYPYVFYPQNFRGSEYYQSSDSLYNRYPPEMQIPVYNRKWHNYYPSPRRYHWGHQFILDVF